MGTFGWTVVVVIVLLVIYGIRKFLDFILEDPIEAMDKRNTANLEEAQRKRGERR